MTPAKQIANHKRNVHIAPSSPRLKKDFSLSKLLSECREIGLLPQSETSSLQEDSLAVVDENKWREMQGVSSFNAMRKALTEQGPYGEKIAETLSLYIGKRVTLSRTSDTQIPFVDGDPSVQINGTSWLGVQDRFLNRGSSIAENVEGFGIARLDPVLAALEKAMQQSIQGTRNAEEKSHLQEMVASLQHTKQELEKLKGSDRDIERRMRVKLSNHYLDMILRNQSTAIFNLVVPNAIETEDLSGQIDPSNQNWFSPVAGVLHKYEMVLLYVALTCSAHCRYCYRSDLFSGISGKSAADQGEVLLYITLFNALLSKVCEKLGERNASISGTSGIARSSLKLLDKPELLQDTHALKEVLLSGGDPGNLTNRRLAKWLALLAESGVKDIRIGTKELAFFPYRFTPEFFEMLDAFHHFYPQTRMHFIVHFTHPDEFLLKENSQYVLDESGNRVWHPFTRYVVSELGKRGHFISMHNQTPIIRNVNDNAESLHILQYEMTRANIRNHNIYVGREIQGHKAFTVPIETCLDLFHASKARLSGRANRGHLCMSTEIGKVEVIGSGTSEYNGKEEKVVYLRVQRSPGDADTVGDMIVCRSDPEALWISDYVRHGKILSAPKGIKEKLLQIFGNEDEKKALQITESSLTEKSFDLHTTLVQNAKAMIEEIKSEHGKLRDLNTLEQAIHGSIDSRASEMLRECMQC